MSASFSSPSEVVDRLRGGDRVRTRTVDVPTGALAALEAHPDEGRPARRPAVLVPGYTGSKEDFLLVLDPIAAAGHPVLTYDQRGQYESRGPDDDGAYVLDALATDLLAVLDAVDADGPVHLVGHSFGGLVARAAALRAPARLASLTLLDSGPAAIVGDRAERVRMLEPLLAAAGLPGVWEAMDAVSRQDPGYLDLPEEFRAFLRTRFLSGSDRALRVMGRALLDEDDRVDELREAVERAGVPVLVCYGADDDAWPPALQSEMAQRLGAPVAVVDGAQHSPAAEQPAATAEVLLDFWRSAER